MEALRQVVMVAAHFPPSNLAAVHRARLWAQHLPEFGWRPIVLTTHHDYYEERLDWDLAALVPESLEVVRTRALPVKPVRLIGDIGIRALPWHLAALKRLVGERGVDFVHITIPSNYSALLGPLLGRSRTVPFGIDYIDPWVHVWPGSEVVGSKAWISRQLARMLEPIVVRDAALITGVAPAYYEGMLERNPRVRERAVCAAMPYGFSDRDFEAVRSGGARPVEFSCDDGRFHLVYAGAMLPKGYAVLEAFFAGMRRLASDAPEHASRLRVHFIGTGRAPDDPAGHNVLRIAEQAGVRQWVTETPQRIGYVDVLRHLVAANGVLVLGSTEAHYSPSKVYQAVQARHPVLALLHERSTAVDVLARSGAGEAIALTEQRLPAPEEVAAALVRMLSGRHYDANRVDWAAFSAFSARESSRQLAVALDEALARRGKPH